MDSMAEGSEEAINWTHVSEIYSMDHDTFDIEQKAARLFCEALGSRWIPHQESLDHGIDYRVELREGRKASGTSFFVQLKGQAKSKRINRDKFIRFDLEIERLKQYDNARLPVYLVVADLSCRTCYFVFLQEFMARMKNQNWRKRNGGKAVIHVPTGNVVTDSFSLADEIARASQYLASKLVGEGIDYEEKFYSSLDSNFSVQVLASSKSKHFMIAANNDSTLHMTFRKSKLAPGEFDKFLRGLPMNVTPDSIVVKGSPLWEHITTKVCEGGGTLTMMSHQEGHLNLSRLDSSGRIKASVQHLPCLIEGGREEWRYHASSAFGIINLSGEVRSKQFGQNQFNFNFKASKWLNKEILRLPYFDEVDGVFFDHGIGDKFLIEMFVEDNDPVVLSMNAAEGSQLDDLRHTMYLLKRTRVVAKFFVINPLLPEFFDKNFADDLDFLHSIATGEDISFDCKFDKLTTTVSLDTAKEFIDERNDNHVVNLMLSDTVVEKSILGERIIVEDWRHFLTSLRFADDYHRIQGLIAKRVESITVDLVPTSATTGRISKNY
ncbi:DUF4365 domain-containing protein [Tundrisphaera lichenicola]|uniref:DUF4365 domain-containing protein n=1 Tax=Tundrisphaera lichenicola TaxID=2029860 RepID=UPI003EBB2C85